jgi:tetratricopeptide (TPR) repeat protein
MAMLGRSAGAKYVIGGSVAGSDASLKMTVEMFRSEDGRRVWTRSYQYQLSRTPEAIADVVRRAQAVCSGDETGGGDDGAEAPPQLENLSAYVMYVRARALASIGADADAAAQYNTTLALNPSFAPAYVGLAEVLVRQGAPPRETLPPDESLALAKRHVQKAVEIGSDTPATAVLQSLVALYVDGDPARAVGAADRALAADRERPDAHRAAALAYAALGRAAAATAASDRAERLDSLNGVGLATAAWGLVDAGACNAATPRFHRAFRLEPAAASDRVAYGLSRCAGLARRPLEAANELRLLRAETPLALSLAARADAAVGRSREALDAIRRLSERQGQYVSAAQIALGQSGAGLDEEAVASLERAFEQQSPWMPFIEHAPEFSSLRANPRFTELVKRVRARAARR